MRSFVLSMICAVVPCFVMRAAENSYNVHFDAIDDARVSAHLLVRTGTLVMVQGFKPDARSASIENLQVTSSSKAVPVTYDAQNGRWRCNTASSKTMPRTS